ncbi:MAG: hypothetical protein DYG88_16085 [Chloroflexi bacterium CFX4]|nr:hypothetical protein [Chloroflexi bacterium CFX4]MDL1921877.1 hypothetical protein [Chloroflexi bacterium CFX3]
MLQDAPAPNAARRVLIVVAGSINYYYDTIGYRLAEAFHNLGSVVDVCTLKTYQPAEYDLTLYVNLYEVAVAYCKGQPDLVEAIRLIKAMKARTTQIGVVLLECVQTNWFAETYRLCEQTGIQALYDLGFHSQYPYMQPAMREGYHFFFNGLTQSERRKVLRWRNTHQERPIPWAFIGHLEKRRMLFAHRLIKRCGANGILYLPHLTHITEEGPHINGEQLQKILERTRYYIWVSHHDYFYVESERFRNALMAGSVPIKVQDHEPTDESARLPFTYLMLNETDFDEQLRAFDYADVRDRFIRDYLTLPSLEAGVARTILQMPHHATADHA